MTCWQAAQGTALGPVERQVYERAAAATRATLGDTVYHTLFTAGQALPWDAALAEALAALAHSAAVPH